MRTTRTRLPLRPTAPAVPVEVAAARRAESARPEKSRSTPKKKAVAVDEYEDDYEETAPETPEERDAVTNKIQTAYVISGFTSVTILSVFIASFLAQLI